ncbi:hypothetical protein [Rickettsia massiliae]|nr:hypothetical protein [Rickettsia massiliae]
MIEDPNTNISSVYNMAYCTVDKIARSPDTAIVKAICQGDYDLVDSILTASKAFTCTRCKYNP